MLFDFFGTLARALSWGPGPAEVLAGHGLALDPAAFARWQHEGADGADHGPHSADRDRYVAWERARWRALAAGCGAGPDRLEAVSDALLVASKDYVLAAYDDAPTTLSALRDLGVTVAVCSNWDWDLDVALDTCGLSGLVDVAVTSARAGARKPHPRIYEAALAACGAAPADTLFVGDTWLADVIGPAAAGIRPVHLCRTGEGTGEGTGGQVAPGPFPRARTLAEVLGHL